MRRVGYDIGDGRYKMLCTRDFLNICVRFTEASLAMVLMVEILSV